MNETDEAMSGEHVAGKIAKQTFSVCLISVLLLLYHLWNLDYTK